MCVCVCGYAEPVSSSKDCVRFRLKSCSAVCLYTPVSPSVPEMEGKYATEDVPLLELLYLILARQVDLPWAIQVFVVSLVRRALLFPLVC